MTIPEANKNVEQSYNFYREYISKAVEVYGNSYLCKKLNKDRSNIINTLKNGSKLAVADLANRIYSVVDESMIS